jgi:hypothetical protein
MVFIKKTTRLIIFIIKTTCYNYAPEILREPCHFRLTCTAGKGSKVKVGPVSAPANDGGRGGPPYCRYSSVLCLLTSDLCPLPSD